MHELLLNCYIHNTLSTIDISLVHFIFANMTSWYPRRANIFCECVLQRVKYGWFFLTPSIAYIIIIHIFVYLYIRPYIRLPTGYPAKKADLAHPYYLSIGHAIICRPVNWSRCIYLSLESSWIYLNPNSLTIYLCIYLHIYASII